MRSIKCCALLLLKEPKKTQRRGWKSNMHLAKKEKKPQGMAGIKSGNYNTNTVRYFTCLKRAAAEEMQYRDTVAFLIRR